MRKLIIVMALLLVLVSGLGVVLTYAPGRFSAGEREGGMNDDSENTDWIEEGIQSLSALDAEEDRLKEETATKGHENDKVLAALFKEAEKHIDSYSETGDARDLSASKIDTLKIRYYLGHKRISETHTEAEVESLGSLLEYTGRLHSIGSDPKMRADERIMWLNSALETLSFCDKKLIVDQFQNDLSRQEDPYCIDEFCAIWDRFVEEFGRVGLDRVKLSREGLYLMAYDQLVLSGSFLLDAPKFFDHLRAHTP
jgi:hypothetical protein